MLRRDRYGALSARADRGAHRGRIATSTSDLDRRANGIPSRASRSARELLHAGSGDLSEQVRPSSSATLSFGRRIERASTARRELLERSSAFSSARRRTGALRLASLHRMSDERIGASSPGPSRGARHSHETNRRPEASFIESASRAAGPTTAGSAFGLVREESAGTERTARSASNSFASRLSTSMRFCT